MVKELGQVAAVSRLRTVLEVDGEADLLCVLGPLPESSHSEKRLLLPSLAMRRIGVSAGPCCGSWKWTREVDLILGAGQKVFAQSVRLAGHRDS